MTWVMIDDQFHSNRKIVRAGLAGAGLYARSLAFCAAESTDGWIPHEWAREVGTAHLIKKLVSVGLWIRVNSGDEIYVSADKRRKGGGVTIVVPSHGYYVPDYLHYNPSRGEVEETRLLKSAAGRKGADSKWHGNRHSTSHSTSFGKTMAPTPTPIYKELPQTDSYQPQTAELIERTANSLGGIP